MAAITDKQMAQAEAQFKKFESMINSMTPVGIRPLNPALGPLHRLAPAASAYKWWQRQLSQVLIYCLCAAGSDVQYANVYWVV